MSTSVDSRVGTEFGKYKITHLLGKGGMGQVYEAYDSAKGRTVALKILADQSAHDESFRTRFLRESHVAAALQEPHIIPIHDWGEIDGTLYIDMRLVQGETLQDSLKKGPLAPSRAVAIIKQIAAALDAAHTAGLIHRDIKPQNIMVTTADFAYLVDFGIAVTSGGTRLTMAGTAIGSFAYMAPERFDDENATPAVDVYSLACVLYQSVTGHTPFPTDSIGHLIAAHMTSPPPRPSIVNPNIPPPFDEVIARGMAKHPDDRYGSAGALARAAEPALRGPGELSDSNTRSAASFAAASTMQAGSAPQVDMPTTGPTTSQSEPTAGGRQWVLPTVIATTSALLLGAIGLVIGLLASGASRQSDTSSPTTTHQAQAPTNYPTGTSPPAPSTPAPPPAPTVTGPRYRSTTPSAPPPRMLLPDADEQGFLSGGARCNYDDHAELMVHTDYSKAIICATPSQRLYYRGSRISDGAVIELDHVERAPAGFVAINYSDPTRYEVNHDGLRIIHHGQEVSYEPAEEAAP